MGRHTGPLCLLRVGMLQNESLFPQHRLSPFYRASSSLIHTWAPTSLCVLLHQKILLLHPLPGCTTLTLYIEKGWATAQDCSKFYDEWPIKWPAASFLKGEYWGGKGSWIPCAAFGSCSSARKCCFHHGHDGRPWTRLLGSILCLCL